MNFSVHKFAVNTYRKLNLTVRKVSHRRCADISELLAVLNHASVDDVIISTDHSRRLLGIHVMQRTDVYVRNTDHLLTCRFPVFVADLMVNFKLDLHRLHFLNVAGRKWELYFEILTEPVGVAALIYNFCLNVAQRPIERRPHAYKSIWRLELIHWVFETHS